MEWEAAGEASFRRFPSQEYRQGDKWDESFSNKIQDYDPKYNQLDLRAYVYVLVYMNEEDNLSFQENVLTWGLAYKVYTDEITSR